MKLSHKNPTTTNSWKELKRHYETIKNTSIKTLFKEDPKRANKMHIQWGDFYLDYSKNHITQETLSILQSLAEEMKLSEAMSLYFSGEKINETENRAVLHTALRSDVKKSIYTEGKDIIPEIQEVKQNLKIFSDAVISGDIKGYTGLPFTDIVNVGIGGSDLGPDMVVEALSFYKNHLNTHFVSNVDGDHLMETLKKLNPQTTLFVIVSKTFTTQETLTNANTIKSWFLQDAQVKDITKHFVAVSTNLEAVANFGIDTDRVFPMWDWVGGRFSLWSAVGLSICLSLGYEHFEALLKGAKDMDNHFKTASEDQNIPITLALISVWYNNFFGCESQAIIPYTQYLKRFSAYLQQSVMESNGKSIGRDANTVNYQTGNIIWGEPGTNAQHAFFQLIHQGTKLIPSDFIGFKKPLHGDMDHHNKLMANFFAQTQALMNGKTKEEVLLELKDKTEDQKKYIAPYKVFVGNKPTNTLLINKLTPASLGSLIALYEHKIFVEGVIWNIFSYDQWGVELGKQLASNILSDIEGKTNTVHDSSTQNLLQYFLKV